MRQIVRDIFPTWSVDFEGSCKYMYLDRLGLVTVAIGNMIEPAWVAQALPFVHPDGSPASSEEITTAWRAVKARKDALVSWRGQMVKETELGGARFAQYTSIRLTDAGIRQIVDGKLDSVDKELVARFGDVYADAPADAQLALCSMSWAMGDHRFDEFVKFCAFVRGSNWAASADECLMKPDEGSLARRNEANKALLLRAAQTQDPDELHWP